VIHPDADLTQVLQEILLWWGGENPDQEAVAFRCQLISSVNYIKQKQWDRECEQRVTERLKGVKGASTLKGFERDLLADIVVYQGWPERLTAESFRERYERDVSATVAILVAKGFIDDQLKLVRKR